jgi:hypothetical protein
MSQKSVWQSHPFLVGALVVIVAALCFVSVAPAVESVSTVGMPTWEVDVVHIAQLLVSAAPVAAIAGFAWSFFGYLRFKVGDDTVNYNLTQLAQTVAWYMAIITPLTYGLTTFNINGVPLGTLVAQAFMTAKAVINQMETAVETEPAPTPPK